MRLVPRTHLILLPLTPLALAGAVAGPAAGATTDCSAWTGSSWARVSSPGPAPSFLNDVSAASASDIWAVGNTSGGPPDGALNLHYDGTSWAQTPSPHAGDGGALLTVNSRTASDAWAGGYVYGHFPNALMLHWDGTSWTPPRAAALGRDTVDIVHHDGPGRVPYQVGHRAVADRRPGSGLVCGRRPRADADRALGRHPVERGFQPQPGRYRAGQPARGRDRDLGQRCLGGRLLTPRAR